MIDGVENDSCKINDVPRPPPPPTHPTGSEHPETFPRAWAPQPTAEMQLVETAEAERAEHGRSVYRLL